jgi:hypothetical protein
VQHLNNDDWWRWYMVEANRRVAKTDIDDDVRVSTVFVSLVLTPDHMPFETMVFGGKHDGKTWRTATWDEAERQHAEVVALVRAT